MRVELAMCVIVMLVAVVVMAMVVMAMVVMAVPMVIVTVPVIVVIVLMVRHGCGRDRHDRHCPASAIALIAVCDCDNGRLGAGSLDQAIDPALVEQPVCENDTRLGKRTRIARPG